MSHRILVIFVLLHSFSYAGGVIDAEETTYADSMHSDLSKEVLYWADYFDRTVSGWMGNCDANITCDVSPSQTKESKTIDSFFQSRKYFNETDDVFIRLRLDTELHTKESNHYNLKLGAQIPFNRCRKQLKIFAENISTDNQKVNPHTKEDDPDFGIRYFDAYKGIDSRYSLGLSGIHPFVSAQYSYTFFTDDWEIEPLQIFKYSTNKDFEEETNIYFDKKIDETSLFRVTLLRKTQSHIDGMGYGLSAQYYFNSRKNKGMRLTQTFVGNTKYHYSVDNGDLGMQQKTFGGIHNYITSFSWRENIWRDWFYYEISPSVNFLIDHDYKPNYSLRIFFDFYFGKYN